MRVFLVAHTPRMDPETEGWCRWLELPARPLVGETIGRECWAGTVESTEWRCRGDFWRLEVNLKPIGQARFLLSEGWIRGRPEDAQG